MTNKGNQPARLQSVDIAKGIGMLCIIAGHGINQSINSIVFTFHVPLFFLISGYFFHPSTDVVSTTRKRCTRLIAPYILCSLACSLGNGLVCALRGNPQESWNALTDMFIRALYGSGSPTSPVLGIGPIGAIWFLLALFWALLMYEFIADKKWASPVVLGLFAVGFATRGWWLPLSIQPALCAIVFVHIGYLAKQNQNLWRPEGKVSPAIPIAAVVVWLVACTFDGNGMSLARNFFDNVPVNIIGAVAGTIVALTVAWAFSKVPILNHALELFGRNSLVVMCFHLFDLNVIPWGLVMGKLGIANDPSSWAYMLVLFSFKVLWAFFGVGVVYAATCLKSAKEPVPSLKPRLRHPDIAQGIAILLVIIAHQMNVDPIVRKLAFSFHMPLFFLANSLFIHEPFNVGKTAKRSARTLIVPYVVVCLLSTGLTALLTTDQTKSAVAHKLMNMVGGMSFTGKLFTGFESVSFVWFVACLFVARILYVLTRQLTARCPASIQYAVSLALCACGYVLGTHQLFLPWSADIALFAQVFMLIGNEAWRKGLLKTHVGLPGVITVFFAWVALSLGGYQIEMATRSYPGALLCIIAALLGSYLIFALSQRIDSNCEHLSAFLSWAGRNSMVILAVHCLNRAWSYGAGGNGFPALGFGWLGSAFAEIAFCLATCYVYNRFRQWLSSVRTGLERTSSDALTLVEESQ